MSIRKALLLENYRNENFPNYGQGTQPLDLMLQNPQTTEGRCDGKLIGVGDLDEEALKLIVDDAKKMSKTTGSPHSCFDYRGYPVIVRYDNGARTDHHLVLYDSTAKKIHKLPVSLPWLNPMK